jgi:Raf kinase inhibitor-like YbhB/YbcL family protein
MVRRLVGYSLMAIGCAVLSACQNQAVPAEEENVMTFSLTSPAMKDGDRVPTRFTEDGNDASPPLEWADPPAGTQSFALICDDPDAPVGTWDHWLIWNLPATLRKLPEGVAKTETVPELGDARQGKNSWPRMGYNGPAPPPGKVHHYNFVLYALDAPLDLKAGANKKALLAAMKGHVLGQGKLTGLYSR